jgi:hypothetical protein
LTTIASNALPVLPLSECQKLIFTTGPEADEATLDAALEAGALDDATELLEAGALDDATELLEADAFDEAGALVGSGAFVGATLDATDELLDATGALVGSGVGAHATAISASNKTNMTNFFILLLLEGCTTRRVIDLRVDYCLIPVPAIPCTNCFCTNK